ncbi:unnamed protein product, partial [Rotaria sp. Silwood1]
MINDYYRPSLLIID